MPRRKNSKVEILFVKVDAKARAARQTARRSLTAPTAVPKLQERTVESLWYDVIPDGFTFLDWHREWNGGYPTEEAVNLYNQLHPDEDEQIELEDEDA